MRYFGAVVDTGGREGLNWPASCGRSREGGPADQELLGHQTIRHAVTAAERNAVLELRDRGRINDEVPRRIEREPDLEALRTEA